MKVFISADLEGVAGVVSWDQTLRDGKGYAQACRWMTEEVKTACEAALAAGATRIVVADSHLTRENIDIDALPASVETVRAGPRPHGMVHGIADDEFDVLLCLGFHTGAHEEGVLNHTCNGAGFHEIRLNGQPADELDIYARLAGQFGVPLGLVTGDRAICESAKRRFPWIETVSVKEAIGRMSATCLSPVHGRAAIGAAVERVLSRLGELQPVRLDGPIDLEIDFKWHHPAETLALLTPFERVGAHTVRLEAADMEQVSQTLEFLGSYKLVPYP